MRLSSRVHPWVAPGIIVLSAILAYSGTLSAPFIFDDLSSVIHNPSIRQLWPPAVVFAPPSECTVAGRPLANLTFALNYALGGLAVPGYHAVNLLVHAAAALLLFGVVRRTLALESRNGSQGSEVPSPAGSAATPAAVAVGAIWAAHPLLTASVSYISQRTEVLMGFFYLGTLYAFVRGVQSGQRGWLLTSVVACFLGTACKEGMVTAPALLLLYDRTFAAGSFREAWRQRRGFYLALASSWLLLGYLMAGLKDRAVGFGLGVPWWNYTLTECQAVLKYLGLVVWPSPLIFDYGALFIRNLTEGWMYALLLAALLALTGAALIWRPRAGFLGAAFFILLAPTSSIVPIATQPIAENRAYLPAAAIVALLVLGTMGMLRRGRSVVWILVAGAMIGLTVARNAVFADRIRLWGDTVAKRPTNPRAHTVYGEALHESKRFAEAKVAFETALRLKPDYPEALTNLGSTLYQLGDLRGAQQRFEAALRLRPDSATAHSNLGNIALQLGDLPRAAAHSEAALRIYEQPGRLKPDLAEVHNTLGNVRLYQGNVAEAHRQYAAAVEANPDFHQARMNLGVALRLLGRLPEARQELERVVRALPSFAEAHFSLAAVWEEAGDLGSAERSLLTAIQLKPDLVQAYLSLGDIRLRKGDITGAKNSLEAAAKLRPDDASIRAKLAEVNSGGASGRRP